MCFCHDILQNAIESFDYAPFGKVDEQTRTLFHANFSEEPRDWDSCNLIKHFSIEVGSALDVNLIFSFWILRLGAVHT